MIIVLIPNESELNSVENKKVEVTMDRHSTPRHNEKERKQTSKRTGCKKQGVVHNPHK